MINEDLVVGYEFTKKLHSKILYLENKIIEQELEINRLRDIIKSFMEHTNLDIKDVEEL